MAAGGTLFPVPYLGGPFDGEDTMLCARQFRELRSVRHELHPDGYYVPRWKEGVGPVLRWVPAAKPEAAP